MTTNDRRRRIVERIEDDERLRGPLEDEAASALIRWAGERAGAAAADASRSDEQVEAAAQAVRLAATTAAATGEADPRRLVARAEAELRASNASLVEIAPAEQPAATAPAAQAKRRAPARRSAKSRKFARYLKQRQASRR